MKHCEGSCLNSPDVRIVRRVYLTQVFWRNSAYTSADQRQNNGAALAQSACELFLLRMQGFKIKRSRRSVGTGVRPLPATMLSKERSLQLPRGPQGGEQVRANLLEATVLAGILLLCANFTLGCATVVAPLKPGPISMPESDHGLVLGRIHLTRSGDDYHTNLGLPIDVKWWVTEETRGRRFMTNHLPTDGRFVVKLSAGSYRLTEVTLDNPAGIWQASLPATFSVRPRECTYLETRNLNVKTGSLMESSHDRFPMKNNSLRVTYAH